MQTMLDRGIATRRIMCAHLEPAYRNYPLRCSLANSEDAHRHCILLPLFPQMTEPMQQEVVVALNSALKEQSQILRFRRNEERICLNEGDDQNAGTGNV